MHFSSIEAGNVSFVHNKRLKTKYILQGNFSIYFFYFLKASKRICLSSRNLVLVMSIRAVNPGTRLQKFLLQGT
jgi:hypothetical protein